MTGFAHHEHSPPLLFEMILSKESFFGKPPRSSNWPASASEEFSNWSWQNPAPAAWLVTVLPIYLALPIIIWAASRPMRTKPKNACWGSTTQRLLLTALSAVKLPSRWPAGCARRSRRFWHRPYHRRIHHRYRRDLAAARPPNRLAWSGSEFPLQPVNGPCVPSGPETANKTKPIRPKKPYASSVITCSEKSSNKLNSIK